MPDRDVAPQSNPPWDAEQVASLNDFQKSDKHREFTCPNENGQHDDQEHPHPILVATEDGWVCPDDDCSYTCGWAWEYMVNRAWEQPAT